MKNNMKIMFCQQECAKQGGEKERQSMSRNVLHQMEEKLVTSKVLSL